MNDTIRELGLGKTIIHLGNVKRSNISFDIQRHDPAQIVGRLDDVKLNLTLKRMKAYIASGEKVLAYFPYRSQVDQIYSLISSADHIKLRRYHGQIPSPERKMTERDYKEGTAMGLFCTKAFGMTSICSMLSVSGSCATAFSRQKGTITMRSSSIAAGKSKAFSSGSNFTSP